MRTQTDLQPGDELLGFRVERVVGRGGMGVVYLAQQLVLDRMVALKLLAPELAENREFRERFLRESRLAASLDHPNIVPVFDAGEVEGRLYIAMRYVEGRDLGVLLTEEGPVEPERAIALLAPVADALDAAHAKGLVHRDVKPSNVLVDESERPYLADFGLTKESSEKGLVEQSHFAASVEYVAPEQIEGKPVDGRADQYALACVLYKALTGSSPFANGSTMATLWGHLDDPPPHATERNTELRSEIDAVFERALAKDPDKRYPTCTEFTDAARDALGLQIGLSRRRWVLALAAAVLVAVAAAAAALVLTFTEDSGPKPDLTIRDNSVLRIDPRTNEISAVVDVGTNPTGIAAGGDTVWAVNFEDGTVSAIDAGSNAVVQTYGIDGSLPFATSALYAIAADDEGAWVISTAGLQRGVLTRLRLDSGKQKYPIDYEPESVAVTENWVWVTTRPSGARGELLRIDPETGAVDKVEGNHPFRQALVGGEGMLWTIAQPTSAPAGVDELATIARRDPDTGEATVQHEVEHEVRRFGSFLDVCAGAAWVHQFPQRRLLVLDAESLRPIGAKGGLKPNLQNLGQVGCGDDSVWWMADGRIQRLDPQSFEVQAEISVGEVPERRSFDPPAGLTRLAVGADGVWVTLGRPQLG